MIDFSYQTCPSPYIQTRSGPHCPFTAHSPGRISCVHVARLLICLKDTKWDRTEFLYQSFLGSFYWVWATIENNKQMWKQVVA